MLASGQGVLNVLSLAGVKDEVDAQLVPLALDEVPARPPLRCSDDQAAHRSTPCTGRSGAKMVPFGGWEMPLEYTRHA